MSQYHGPIMNTIFVMVICSIITATIGFPTDVIIWFSKYDIPASLAACLQFKMNTLTSSSLSISKTGLINVFFHAEHLDGKKHSILIYSFLCY